jgi:hypothetical protein
MAYQKIVVNTTLAVELIASDKLPIPTPNLETLSGTTTSAKTGELIDAITGTNSTDALILTDAAKDFIALGVKAGDTVTNTTTPGTTTVTSVATTELTLKEDIFASTGDGYTVGSFLRLGVNIGDIVYNTTDDTSTTVTTIVSSTVLEVADDIFASAENYKIFLGGPVGSSQINSSEGCLLYIGSAEATMSAAKSFVDIRVKTAAGSDVIFRNFRVGDYLPIQVLRLYATGTDTAALKSCIAIW